MKADLKLPGGTDTHPPSIASESTLLRRSFDDSSRSVSRGRGGRTGSVTRAGDDSKSKSGDDTCSRVEVLKLKQQCAEGARQRAALRVQLHAKQTAEMEQQRIAQGN